MHKNADKTPMAPFPARQCFKEDSPAGQMEALPYLQVPTLPTTFFPVTGQHRDNCTVQNLVSYHALDVRTHFTMNNHFGIVSGKG